MGKGGLAAIYINGEKVADGRIKQTQPFLFSLDETADVGKDNETQVANSVFEDVKDSEFSGVVEKVEIKISDK